MKQIKVVFELTNEELSVLNLFKYSKEIDETDLVAHSEILQSLYEKDLLDREYNRFSDKIYSLKFNFDQIEYVTS